MKKINYQTKSLIITSLIAFILCIITSCFAWWNSQLDKCIAIMQNDLELTNEELVVTQENLRVEIDKSIELSEDLEVANNTIADLKSEEYELIYLGDFKITYYCDSRFSHICGGNGVTASGKPTEVDVTAAADWSILPNGSKVYIQNVGWREIQDIGGGVNGKHVDVLVNTHSEALSFGTSIEGVWLLIRK